jgi:Zn finger protein HypA/HybF involved in hydrogenase expression
MWTIAIALTVLMVRSRAMSYYEADAWANHELNEVKCAECEEYFDDQEREGNICPPCIEKEGE